MTDDTDRLRELGRELPALDLDPDAAARIARAARRGPPRRRFIEPVLVALFAASFLAWALYKVCEAFR
jgi:hypothetical protein